MVSCLCVKELGPFKTRSASVSPAGLYYVESLLGDSLSAVSFSKQHSSEQVVKKKSKAKINLFKVPKLEEISYYDVLG